VNVSRIKGGNDRLVQALAKQQGLKILFKSPVTRIEHDDREVRVVAADGSKRGAMLKADYAVLAAPAPIARVLDVDPAPPPSL
jgi:monoamine oxidase